MPNRQKEKGNRFERALVNEINRDYDFVEAERARGSDGRSLGLDEGVDILLKTPRGSFTVQAKSRAKIPLWLGISEGCDITMVKEDRGKVFVIAPLDLFIEMTDLPYEVKEELWILEELRR